MNDKLALLLVVRKAVQEDPNMLQEIVMSCQQGLLDETERHSKRAMDFETATCALLNACRGGKNQRGHLELAQDMIMRHEGKTQNNWPAYADHLPLVAMGKRGRA